MLIRLGWIALLVAFAYLTISTTAYIAGAGLVADRPPLSMLQTGFRFVLVAGSIGLLFVRRDTLERVALVMGAAAAGSSAVYGFGVRSPMLSALRLLFHLALYALATIACWRQVVRVRR